MFISVYILCKIYWRCEDKKCKGRIVMNEKILLKCQLTQHLDDANSKQRYKNRDVNKKKNNGRFFGLILDRFRRS